MQRFFIIRAKIFIRSCRWGFAILVAWFSFGTFAFYRWERTSLTEAMKVALFLRFHPSNFWLIYSIWGQWVVFGVVISFFVLQALQRYNPQEVCRMLAHGMKNHAIIVGYTHLGARVVEYFRQTARPYVLIDKDSSVVDDLVRTGEPIIVDDARQETTLIDAGVERASLIVIATNNIDTALLVTKRARERNKQARIIVRCYLDEFTEILEGLGATEIISSSKSAFREIESHLDALISSGIS
jgi:TrkA-N domain